MGFNDFANKYVLSVGGMRPSSGFGIHGDSASCLVNVARTVTIMTRKATPAMSHAARAIEKPSAKGGERN